MDRMICLGIGYLCGLLQSGYLYGRTRHMDIRQYGSGNVGTTNSLRVMGKKAGAVVFLGDFLKAFVPVLLIRLLLQNHANVDLLAFYAGVGVTLGHNFPFYLKFRGGKGIACMAGIMTAMDIRIALVCLVVFSVSVAITRYVSLGSILISVVFFAGIVMFGRLGSYEVDAAHYPELCAVSAFLMCLAVWRHRSNIGRLLAGTENKLGAKKA